MASENNSRTPECCELAAYVEYNQPLPEDFLPRRRGELEAEDIRSLQKSLERYYNLDKINFRQRCVSVPPALGIVSESIPPHTPSHGGSTVAPQDQPHSSLTKRKGLHNSGGQPSGR